jgi:hypothetical protein
MRSTTFDLVGMALMALAIVLTVGVGIVKVYLNETRGWTQTSHHEKRPAVPPAESSDETPPVAVHR